ncbi:MAG TPA: hypothetical protein VIV60_29620 [Polyangiaceae bacterium]
MAYNGQSRYQTAHRSMMESALRAAGLTQLGGAERNSYWGVSGQSPYPIGHYVKCGPKKVWRVIRWRDDRGTLQDKELDGEFYGGAWADKLDAWAADLAGWVKSRLPLDLQDQIRRDLITQCKQAHPAIGHSVDWRLAEDYAVACMARHEGELFAAWLRRTPRARDIGPRAPIELQSLSRRRYEACVPAIRARDAEALAVALSAEDR